MTRSQRVASWIKGAEETDVNNEYALSERSHHAICLVAAARLG